MMMMTPLASLVLALAAAPPLTPGADLTLPYGAWFELEDCFTEGGDACARAVDPSLVSATLARHLRCAGAWLHELTDVPDAARAEACRELGVAARAEDRRLAATVWLVTACAERDEAACGAFSRAAAFGRPADAILAQRDPDAPLGAGPERDLGVLAALAAACDGDDLDACLDLVNAHHRLRGGPATDAAAAGALARACAGGSAAACELARHRDAPDAPVDPVATDALASLDALCGGGRAPRACALGSRLLDSGRALPWGHLGGLARADRACATGERAGCDRLLTGLGEGGLGPTLLTRCAEVATSGEGDPRTCTLAATMRAAAAGLPRDTAAFSALSRSGCVAGDARACHALVDEAATARDRPARQAALELACVAGDGTACGEAGRARIHGLDEQSPDPEGGRRLFAKGCKLGSAFACYELGFLHSRGIGTMRDATRAAPLYSVACARGSVQACAGLGMLYVDGRGVARDGERAAWLLGLACSRGYAVGCRTLGDVHAHGYADVPRLPASARAAYRAACELGDRQGCERQAELGPGPEAPAAEGVRPELLASVAEALDGERPDEQIPDRPGPAPGRGGATMFAQAWTGVELGVSRRDTSVLPEAERARTSDVRLTYPGFDLGALYGQRGGGYGFRLQLGVSFDLGNAFDAERSNSPRLGGLHLEANLDAFLSVGGDVLVALAAGWHGVSGPLTKNSSLALSLLLIGPARSRDDVGWFLRVTPVQLFAANERWLLSPLAVEARVVFGAGFSAGLELQYIGAPDADTQDLVAAGWALLFRFGSGLVATW